MTISPATLAMIEAVLPPHGSAGIAPIEVLRRVGCWSLITTRHGLRELCGKGRATYSGPDSQRRYTLALPTTRLTRSEEAA